MWWSFSWDCKSFAQVKTQVLLMDPLPPMNKVYSLLIQEEMQRNFGNGSYFRVESTDHATKGQNFTINASSRHGINHPKGKERPQCTQCGKLRHTTNKCYKLDGFPLGFKFKNKNSMAHQISSIDQSWESSCAPIQTSMSCTLDQFHQLLALIGFHNQPLSMNYFPAAHGKEFHMAKNVVVPSLPSNSVADKTSFLLAL